MSNRLSVKGTNKWCWNLKDKRIIFDKIGLRCEKKYRFKSFVVGPLRVCWVKSIQIWKLHPILF